jgi:integral membrane protein
MTKAWYNNSLNRFRVIARCEAISFLLLLFVAMPLKYFAGLPEAVMYTGWIHGALFMAYMIFGLEVKLTYNWSWGRTILAVIASLIPFGPFIFDKSIFRVVK